MFLSVFSTRENKNTTWRSMDVLLKEYEQCEPTVWHPLLWILNILLDENVPVCYGSIQPSQWMLSDLDLLV